MELTLTEDDARTLRDFLRDHLNDLKWEVVRTEAESFRQSRRMTTMDSLDGQPRSKCANWQSGLGHRI